MSSRTSIPSVVSKVPRDVRAFNDRVRETLESSSTTATSEAAQRASEYVSLRDAVVSLGNDIGTVSDAVDALTSRVDTLEADFRAQVARVVLSAVVAGTPGSSATLLAALIVEPMTLVSGTATAAVKADAETTLDIQQNGSSIGELVFAADASTATASFTVTGPIYTGDGITIVAPAVPDATLADITMTLIGAKQ